MFELPEVATLARQVNETLAGKRVKEATLGTVAHKFIWYNRTPAEFAALARGKTIGRAYARGKWLFIPLEPGFMLLFGEFGGRFLYHAPGAAPPARRHLLLTFDDGSSLSETTQMWGAMELHRSGEERDRKYIRDMRPAPNEPEFTLEYFSALIDDTLRLERKSAKGLLTQDQLIPGLGNAIAQDILFAARLSPPHPIDDLDQGRRRKLHAAIKETVAEATRLGGRDDEIDLYGNPGGYARMMDKDAVGRPCPSCGTKVVKLQYLGGACYYCPNCQG